MWSKCILNTALVLSGEINANEEALYKQNTFNAEEPNYGMYECINVKSSYHKYSLI